MPLVPFVDHASLTLSASGVGVGLLVTVIALRFIKAMGVSARQVTSQRAARSVDVLALPLTLVLLGWIVALAATWL